ncbi:hypothetical protein [Companilactobacillus nodensis]|nr:hypothetical protein [Companilactobacillus nodensis]
MNKIIVSTIVTIFFIALIPVTLLFSSDVAVRDRAFREATTVLDSNDSAKYGDNQQTKTYLQNHPYLKLQKLTDLQGSDDQGSFFIGKTKQNILLKIYVKFAPNQSRLEDFQPVLHIKKIKLMKKAAVTKTAASFDFSKNYFV